MDNEVYINIEDIGKDKKRKKGLFSDIGKELKALIVETEQGRKEYVKSDSWKKIKKYLAGVQKNFAEENSKKAINKSISPIIGKVEQPKDIKFNFL